ncbi:MAG: hypothetical protein V1495_10440 [Pseudomonadota bacterium]
MLFLLCAPSLSLAGIRVIVAPVHGNAKYPLIMNGVRQVLMTDLAQSGLVNVVTEEIPEDRLTTVALEQENELPAVVVLFLNFIEGVTDFTLSVRVNDVRTGFSSGAEIRVSGDPEIKYSRAEQGAFLYLRKGKHKITVTHEGRSIERVIDIYEFTDKSLSIDLQTTDEAEESLTAGRELTDVAQEFENEGRLEDAAKMYDKAGAPERAGGGDERPDRPPE